MNKFQFCAPQYTSFHFIFHNPLEVFLYMYVYLWICIEREKEIHLFFPEDGRHRHDRSPVEVTWLLHANIGIWTWINQNSKIWIFPTLLVTSKTSLYEGCPLLVNWEVCVCHRTVEQVWVGDWDSRGVGLPQTAVTVSPGPSPLTFSPHCLGICGEHRLQESLPALLLSCFPPDGFGIILNFF